MYFGGFCSTFLFAELWCLQLSYGFGDYERVFPRLNRLRRSPTDGESFVADDLDLTNQDAALVLVVRTVNQTFYLELSPVWDAMWGNWSLTWPDPAGCLYRGEVISEPSGYAALSLCQGDNHMYGLWSSPSGHYVLRPEGSLTKEGVGSHALRLIRNDQPGKTFCQTKRIPKDNSTTRIPSEPHKDQNVSWNHVEDEISDEKTRFGRSRRHRRSGGDAKYIETAIFADKALTNKFNKRYGYANGEKGLKNYVLAIINEVQTIYKYRTMGSNVNLVIQKFEVIQDKEPAPETSGGEIDGYLNKFCAWQAKSKGKAWDHAIMITGLNLYKTRPANNQVIGQAWVEGMCLPKYSCTVNEGDDFEAAFVIAHELGHNLGMIHDGDGNRCNPNSDIMSASTGAGKTHWSSCSNASLKKFLRSKQAKCLDNAVQPKSDLNYAKSGLPGQRYTLDTQCKMALGSIYVAYTSTSHPFDDPCRQTWCLNPRTSMANTTHPALEGTKCSSSGKICLQGKCSVQASSSKKAKPKSKPGR